MAEHGQRKPFVPSPSSNRSTAKEKNLLSKNERTLAVQQIYVGLNSWQTRLLNLHGGTGDAPLFADLEIASLTQMKTGLGVPSRVYNVEFCALSYSWGHPVLSRSITLNGTEFEITQSLEEALLNLRYTKSSRYLWCDAICINQDDLREKERQIRNMHLIFNHAESVIVWLGTGTPHTSLAIESLENPTVLANLVKNHKWDTVEDVRTSLVDMATRPWFGRVWIVQEVAASAGKIQVKCGSFTTNWTALMILPSVLRTIRGVSRNGGLTRPDGPMTSRHEASLETPLDMEQMVHVGGKSQTSSGGVLQETDSRTTKQIEQAFHFLDCWVSNRPFAFYEQAANFGDADSSQRLARLLFQARHLKASDQRDRIFALLNLVRDRDVVDKGADAKDSELIIPEDYSRSCIEIFKQVSKLMGVKSLYYLSNAAHLPPPDQDEENHVRSLPSWCPDWRYLVPEKFHKVLECKCISAPWFEMAFEQHGWSPPRESHPNGRSSRAVTHYKNGWAGVSYGQNLRDGEYRFDGDYHMRLQPEEFERMLIEAGKRTEFEFFPYCVSSGIWLDGYKCVGKDNSSCGSNDMLRIFGWQIARVDTVENLLEPIPGPMSTAHVQKSPLMVSLCKWMESRTPSRRGKRIGLAVESTLFGKSLNNADDYETAVSKHRRAAIQNVSASDTWRISAPTQNDDLLVIVQGGSLPIVLRPIEAGRTTYRYIGYAAPILETRRKQDPPVCFAMKTFIESWNSALKEQGILEEARAFDLI